MDHIVLSVSDLVKLASLLKSHGMDYVCLDLQEADPPGIPDPLPACAFVSAMKSSDPSVVFELEELPEADSGKCTFKPGLFHMSITD